MTRYEPIKFRSSHRRCSVKKVFLKLLQNSHQSTCAIVFFNKVAGQKKRLWHRCFLVNFAKFLRTTFLQNTSGNCFWKLYSNNGRAHSSEMFWKCQSRFNQTSRVRFEFLMTLQSRSLNISYPANVC